MGLDSLTPILWTKISNGATESEGNGAGFYGKPYQPGAIIKNDFEYILFLRKEALIVLLHQCRELFPFFPRQRCSSG